MTLLIDKYKGKYYGELNRIVIIDEDDGDFEIKLFGNEENARAFILGMEQASLYVDDVPGAYLASEFELYGENEEDEHKQAIFLSGLIEQL